jgi:uncharacterized membrane protein
MMGLYLQSIVYIIAGIAHLVKPRPFLSIMPPYVPAHQLMVGLSGIAEILLGIGLLIPATRSWAAWGLILLLIAVFPANIYMATADKFVQIPALIRWGRLPLQGLLIWWAYRYT